MEVYISELCFWKQISKKLSESFLQDFTTTKIRQFDEINRGLLIILYSRPSGKCSIIWFSSFCLSLSLCNTQPSSSRCGEGGRWGEGGARVTVGHRASQARPPNPDTDHQSRLKRAPFSLRGSLHSFSCSLIVFIYVPSSFFQLSFCSHIQSRF